MRPPNPCRVEDFPYIHARMYDQCMVRRPAAEAAATRKALLDAALVVFSDGGFTTARLEDIAHRAGVTRGALYHHFEGKAAIYDAVLRDAADAVMAPLAGELTSEGPPLERLRRFLRSYCTALTRDADFRTVLRLLLLDATEPAATSRATTALGYDAWLTAFESVMQEAADRGELRPTVSPREAALLVTTLAVGATAIALHGPTLPFSAEVAGPL